MACENEVSNTAHGVAYLRGFEAKLHPDNPIFVDPYSLMLGEQIGKQWLEAELKKLTHTPEKEKSLLGHYVNIMAVRARKIDDAVISLLSDDTQSLSIRKSPSSLLA
jgi:O-methyltransferase involved in polyketide biosynthesis